MLLQSASQAERLALLTEDKPPYNMLENGKVVGLATRIVEETMSRAGVTYDIAIYPWLRAYNMTLHKTDGCLFSTMKTPDREPLFKWVGPFSADHMAIFTRPENPITVASIEDLKPFRFVGVKGDAYTEKLKDMGLRVDEIVLPYSDVDAVLVKKVREGKLDFVVLGRWTAKYMTHRTGAADLREVYDLGGAPGYIACNRAVSDATIARLQQSLDSIIADGTRDRLEDTYR